MANKQPVIGIVGGMGPLAGVILCSQIMACTEARTDQQHLSVIADAERLVVEDRHTESHEAQYAQDVDPVEPAHAQVPNGIGPKLSIHQESPPEIEPALFEVAGMRNHL